MVQEIREATAEEIARYSPGQDSGKGMRFRGTPRVVEVWDVVGRAPRRYHIKEISGNDGSAVGYHYGVHGEAGEEHEVKTIGFLWDRASCRSFIFRHCMVEGEGWRLAGSLGHSYDHAFVHTTDRSARVTQQPIIHTAATPYLGRVVDLLEGTGRDGRRYSAQIHEFWTGDQRMQGYVVRSHTADGDECARKLVAPHATVEFAVQHLTRYSEVPTVWRSVWRL